MRTKRVIYFFLSFNRFDSIFSNQLVFRKVILKLDRAKNFNKKIGRWLSTNCLGAKARRLSASVVGAEPPANVTVEPIPSSTWQGLSANRLGAEPSNLSAGRVGVELGY